MLKVAIVGCGRIAEVHGSQLREIGGCRIVGACDSSAARVAEFSRRFNIGSSFTDLAELLSKTRPDVVHVTTSADSHFEISRFCLAQGCHVYVEKPFTLTATEARSLIDLADEQRLKVTVGHNNQFSTVARRMRALIKDGYLGGSPFHIESHYSYDLSDPMYARGLLADKSHWVRRLPGKLLQNVISHGIARLSEFLTTANPQVVAHGFVSNGMKQLGHHDILDELRVMITENERTTAYFTFSSQIRPPLHEVRVCGPKNGLLLDQNGEVLIKLPGRRFRSYTGFVVPQLLRATQHLANVAINTRLFLGGDLYKHSGMRHLIQAFYGSVRGGTPPPIPYQEILRTATIMDSIFAQLTDRRSNNSCQVISSEGPAR